MALRKKVFVSGCFDMLHSGHVAFLKEAAQYGDVYVGLGSDRTIRELKGREPVNSEDERAYMLAALKFVTNVTIAATRIRIWNFFMPKNSNSFYLVVTGGLGLIPSFRKLSLFSTFKR